MAFLIEFRVVLNPRCSGDVYMNGRTIEIVM